MENDQVKQLVQDVFSRAAATYGQVGPDTFNYFGRQLVAFAAVPPGARVLDLACGRGAVLFPAAEAVGPTGAVVGVDFTPAMVAATAQEIAARGLRQARVTRMDAEDLKFSDQQFDYVLCGFALFFFPQLAQALAGIRRVLAPGGVLAVSTFGRQDERWSWLDRLIQQFLKPDSEARPEPRQGPYFGSPAGVTAILADGGFRLIRAETQTVEMAFRSNQEWWAASWSHGSRRPLEEIEEKLGASALERFRVEAFTHLQAIETPGGIPERIEAVLAAGQKE